MNVVVFIGALAIAVIALEIGTGIQNNLFRRSRLEGGALAGSKTAPRRSTWEALLIAVSPGRFDPNRVAANTDVIDLLRRAGYPQGMGTPGEFYASAIKYFTVYLTAGAVAAGALFILGLGGAAPFLAAAFIYMGLTRPYAYLRGLAKKRAEAMRNNMLVGLAVFESLMVGTGIQEALKETSKMGGPFCNMMGLLAARLEIESAEKAIETTRAHIPDPNDVDMQLFLRNISDTLRNSRPLMPGISALRVSVHRSILEATERRAAVVLQRTSILGIFAVVGLILSIILPFMNM